VVAHWEKPEKSRAGGRDDREKNQFGGVKSTEPGDADLRRIKPIRVVGRRKDWIVFARRSGV